MNYSPFKEALLRKRGEILSTGGGVKPLPATIEVNSRQGDLADQASGNNEVHIQLKLKQTDAKILQAIEEALYRMEKGTYGICRDCGEEIAAAAAERHSLDPRLHHLQGKAKLVKATELLAVLREFYRDKLDHDGSGTSPSRRHVAALRFQQHLPVRHLPRGRAAELAARRHHRHGQASSSRWRSRPSPPRKGETGRRSSLDRGPRRRAELRRTSGARGSRRMPNARHRSMLRVILGETLEHKRFFEQALAGRTDLLGRRADGAGTGGGVLGTRWIEQ